MIVDERIEVFYSVAGRSLPSVSMVQELSRGDKQHIFLSVMHCSACAVLFSDTELINYEVLVILSTLYYWYHQISFREVMSPSKASSSAPPTETGAAENASNRRVSYLLQRSADFARFKGPES